MARQPHVLARRAHRIDCSGQGRMVCSPDARSLRLPGHQPEEQRKDQAVPGNLLLSLLQRVVTRAIGDQPGHPFENDYRSVRTSILIPSIPAEDE
ncbi:MAG: hypothetical protein ACREIO_09885 [Nitrospiraceae bacterium]